MSSKKIESPSAEKMSDDKDVGTANKKKPRERRTVMQVDAEETRKLQKRRPRKRGRSRGQSRSDVRDPEKDEGDVEEESGESQPPREKELEIAEDKPKRKFKRAAIEEDITMLDKAMRECAENSRAVLSAASELAEVFRGAIDPSTKKKRVIKRAHILPLIDRIIDGTVKNQERLVAVATNQKSFQDGAGNLLLDTLRGTLSSASNAVPVMPITQARYIAGRSRDSSAINCVWNDIDDLIELMSIGRGEDVEKVRFTKDDEKKPTEYSSSTDEDGSSAFFPIMDDEEEKDWPESPVQVDYSKPGQLASVFFGIAVSKPVRQRLAPPGIMNSDWLVNAVRPPDGRINASPTALVGGGTKESARRREGTYQNTSVLSFRADSNVGAGLSEPSVGARQIMVPDVVM
jgi:hypothetical protein